MAIKTVDIGSAGVIESIRSGLPVATETANGLMGADYYTYGDRFGLKAGAENAGKCFCLGEVKENYRRNAIHLFGFFENSLLSYDIIFSTRYNANAIISIYQLAGDIHVKFYKKVEGDTTGLYIRSTGNTGNPLYIQTTYINTAGISKQFFGKALDFNDTFEEISVTDYLSQSQ